MMSAAPRGVVIFLAFAFVYFLSALLRAVTATLPPFCKTSCAKFLPKPVEQPVINQTLFILYIL